jgi:rare lipoprotein A
MKKPTLFVASLFILQAVSTQTALAQDSSAVARKTTKPAKIQYGIASFYHNKFQGRKTATGELFDQQKMTAAHNSVPMNTWIKVTSLRSGKWVVVRVNDRLHPKNTRLVDLSRTAAERLGYIGRGITRVKVEVLGKKKPKELLEAQEELEAKAKTAGSTK